MLVAIAGRVARVVVAETPGVYRPSWSIEQVGEDLNAIRDTCAPLVFPVVPDGHADHIRYSFEMARPATMRAAERPEEKLGNRARPATMRAAERPEEKLGNRARPATMRAAERPEEKLGNRAKRDGE
jgi:LmbE family N-acetylglucosaminyl deacetylase